MANNFTAQNATGASVTFISQDTGGGVQLTNSQPYDGVNLQKSASATNLAAKSTVNAMLVSKPGQWIATSAPAVNNAASASQAAAGSGIRNVIQTISMQLAGDSTGAEFNGIVNLRDGATGAGTILATFAIAIPATAGSFANLSLSELNIAGTANTATCLEFTLAGTHALQSCTIIGTTTT